MCIMCSALFCLFITTSHLVLSEVSAGMVLLLAPHLHQHRLLLPLKSSLPLDTPLLFLPLLPHQPWLLPPDKEGWVLLEPWWTSVSGLCSVCWALRNWPRSGRPVCLGLLLMKPSTSHTPTRWGECVIYQHVLSHSKVYIYFSFKVLKHFWSEFFVLLYRFTLISHCCFPSCNNTEGNQLNEGNPALFSTLLIIAVSV